MNERLNKKKQYGIILKIKYDKFGYLYAFVIGMNMI